MASSRVLIPKKKLHPGSKRPWLWAAPVGEAAPQKALREGPHHPHQAATVVGEEAAEECQSPQMLELMMTCRLV